MATAVRRSALERSASHSRRDAVVREFLPLADALARRFQRRFPDLIELDDAHQVARFELISAAACLKAGFHPLLSSSSVSTEPCSITCGITLAWCGSPAVSTRRAFIPEAI
jgi:hypothetical protein